MLFFCLDERIAQLVKEIESKRTERYENEQQIETLKGRVAELYQGMEQLELEKERFDLSFLWLGERERECVR